MFNERILPSLREFREILLSESHIGALKRPSVDEPSCTRSQYVRYVDSDGRMVAEVHRYLRPDGTIGASGVPDPKRISFGGTLYVADD